MSPILELRNLGVSYRSFELGPLDLVLQPGLILGLAGHNGAGKTTTLHSIIGMVKATGTMNAFGEPIHPMDASWKKRLGFVPDEPAFFENWTGERNLDFVSGYYPTWSEKRARELADRFHLDLKKKARELSKGNRTKLSLVMAMAHEPDLLVLDEPTSGLDPVVRSEVLEVISDCMISENRSVLFSTHILSDLARIADAVAFLAEGRLLLQQDTAELVEPWRRVSFNYPFEKLAVPGIVEHRCDGQQHQVVTNDFPALKQGLETNGIYIREASRLTLDEVAVYILKSSRGNPC